MSGVRRIISGQPGAAGKLADYRRFMADGALIEEFWWAKLDAPLRNALGVMADDGWVWVRFWLPDHDAVLDKVFDADLQFVGAHIDVTTPITLEGNAWVTTDLWLDIWLTPDGRVIVLQEEEFEKALSEGYIASEDASWAEQQVREITRRIAARSFPPQWIAQYAPSPPPPSQP
ncbi:MAG: DUF402 domain-containing protein [Chloroflexi bacterium]|nr:DUF402 domain-containing protein [Chloroflexota bacterium]